MSETWYPAPSGGGGGGGDLIPSSANDMQGVGSVILKTNGIERGLVT